MWVTTGFFSTSGEKTVLTGKACSAVAVADPPAEVNPLYFILKLYLCLPNQSVLDTLLL